MEVTGPSFNSSANSSTRNSDSDSDGDASFEEMPPELPSQSQWESNLSSDQGSSLLTDARVGYKEVSRYLGQVQMPSDFFKRVDLSVLETRERSMPLIKEMAPEQLTQLTSNLRSGDSLCFPEAVCYDLSQWLGGNEGVIPHNDNQLQYATQARLPNDGRPTEESQATNKTSISCADGRSFGGEWSKWLVFVAGVVIGVAATVFYYNYKRA